jgi:hypothetical protein
VFYIDQAPLSRNRTAIEGAWTTDLNGSVHRFDSTAPVAGDRFIEVVFTARADQLTDVRGTVQALRDRRRRPVKQYMGRLWVGPDGHMAALWGYLPRPARSIRLVLDARAPIAITDVRVEALERLPGDDVARSATWRVVKASGAKPGAAPAPRE